ncbi:MAG: hypothetical protein GY928_33730 [Colwellia sp.]|nr:hypothetical protein [Colwellia sp.]
MKQIIEIEKPSHVYIGQCGRGCYVSSTYDMGDLGTLKTISEYKEKGYKIKRVTWQEFQKIGNDLKVWGCTCSNGYNPTAPTNNANSELNGTQANMFDGEVVLNIEVHLRWGDVLKFGPEEAVKHYVDTALVEGGELSKTLAQAVKQWESKYILEAR